MKKTILTFGALAFLFSSGFAQTNNEEKESVTQDKAVTVENMDAPDIVFESEMIDYGTIPNAADGTREFKFWNKGKTPLIISNARGSCGCTVPTWPKEPVLPGQSSVISVHYDTKRTGNFTKTVTLTSNAKIPTKTLTIKGNVLPDPNAPVNTPATPATVTPVKKNTGAAPLEKTSN